MTRRQFIRLLGWVVFLGMVGLGTLAGCQRTGVGPNEAEASRVPVVASIAPLADLVRQVGGERVTVTLMVPPNISPHHYEPTAQQMEAVSRAKLMVLNGAGLEFWAPDVIRAAQNPNLKVIELAEGLPRKGDNPHLWLNPVVMMTYTDRVAQALSEVDPAGKAIYEANAAAYKADLQALDKDIRAALAGVPDRKVVTLHPAWEYFADEYGLEVVAVIQPTPAKEPSPAEVAAIIDLMRAEGVRVIIVESQMPPHIAQSIAQETGAQLVYMDPIGGVPPRETYIKMMRWNVNELVKALGAGASP
ncbi:MAG: zinc ABC transporter substrate-binding protein [Chloroflexi bacterium]|nr:zinc ABC transporter substrate-binding protein [Chloroflexota bacterium]